VTPIPIQITMISSRSSPKNWQKATAMMSDETERRPLVVRLPEEIKTWIEEKAVQDERSQNTVVVRILRARMMIDAEKATG
jgi:hypothetical protein